MLELLVIILAFCVLAAAVAWHLIEHHRGRRLAVRHRVVVNLVDGTAVSGVLWSRIGRQVVIRGAELLERGSEPVGVDGEVVIDRDRVAFVQIAGEAWRS